MTELELVIREAEPQDAKSLIDFLNQVGKESDYMTLDAAGILMTEEQMSSFIQHQTASDNQIYLIALLDNEVAGLVSITADFHERIRHIGQVFIVVKRAFWNQGLGKFLLEEAIDWAENSGVIRRLELMYKQEMNVLFICIRRLGLRLRAFKKEEPILQKGNFLMFI